MQQQPQQPASTLAGQGFRFVFEAGRYVWRHALEVKPGAIDCSDMDDDAFERFVAEHAEAA